MPALIRPASASRQGWRSRRPQRQNLFLASAFIVGEEVLHTFSQWGPNLRKNIKKSC